MLNSLKLIGDMHTAGSFCEADLCAIRNPKWQAKVKRYMSRIPYKINLIIANQDEQSHLDGLKKALLSDSKSGNAYGIAPWVLEMAEKGAITVVLGGNRELHNGKSIINSEPFTPWIVVHRLVHAIDFGNDHKMLGEAAKTLTDHLPKTYENYGIKALDAYDFYTELATKYIINGRLRRPEGSHPARSERVDFQTFRDVSVEEDIQAFEAKANELLDISVNHAFYF